jgi:hypothetical protein
MFLPCFFMTQENILQAVILAGFESFIACSRVTRIINGFPLSKTLALKF